MIFFYRYVSNLLTGGTALIAAYYGPGIGAILLDDIQCVGNESRLWDCPNIGIGIHNCGHYEDASVQCIGEIWLAKCVSHSTLKLHTLQCMLHQ